MGGGMRDDLILSFVFMLSARLDIAGFNCLIANFSIPKPR